MCVCVCVCVCVTLLTMNIHSDYQDITSIENLFQAWDGFKKGKKRKRDVQAFELNLEDNLFNLRRKLISQTYQHGDYQSFYVHDPKKRHIHKAGVEDRILHHLLYTFLYKATDHTFIFDSYSCRLDKGTHKAVARLEKFARIVSQNYTRNCWSLKCDIKKFFASVDHQILKNLLRERIKDKNILRLLSQVIHSFNSDRGRGQGIPLGNLTSQIFANIYLNRLDHLVKHQLKVKYYLRYADDFVFLSQNKKELESYIGPLQEFLEKELKLEMHSKKIIFRKLDWGIEFLGYVVLPHYRLPRTKTKRRIFEKLRERIGSPAFEQSLQSYLGYLSHANSFELTQRLKNQIWLWLKS